MLFYGWGWVDLKSMVLFRSSIFCQLFQVLKLLCFEDKEVRFSAPNPPKPKKKATNDIFTKNIVYKEVLTP